MNFERKKQMLTLVFAGCIGLIVSFGVGQYVQSNIKEQTKQLAKQYQKKNAAVVQEMEKMQRDLNKSMASQQALAKQIQQIQSAPPQMIVQPTTPQGKEVIDTTIFAELTPPGKRAITVLIDSLSAVGGLVNPGDFVDIIANLKVPHPTDPEGDLEDMTTVLFQNLQVLAVNTNFKPVGNSEIYSEQAKARQLSVTIAVDPEESGLVTFAQKNGKLQLVLRPPTDIDTELLQVSSWELLADYALDRQGTEIIVPVSRADIRASDDGSTPAEVKPFIEIFRGGQEL